MQVQHKINERVLDCIEKEMVEMKKPTSEATLTKITQALEEGRELIACSTQKNDKKCRLL